jgi:hypothetical protein
MQARLADIREVEGPDAADMDVPEPPGPNSTAAERIAWANARFGGEIMTEQEVAAADEEAAAEESPKPTSTRDERLAKFNELSAEPGDDAPADPPDSETPSTDTEAAVAADTP